MFIAENNWKYFLAVYILPRKFTGELVSLDWLDVLRASSEMIPLHIKKSWLKYFSIAKKKIKKMDALFFTFHIYE